MADYKEIWNELCYGINEKYHNSPESKLQMFAEFIFSKLGWSESQGEIVAQRVIKTGSAGSLKPDIIITDGQNDFFVVELKVPNLQTSEGNLIQITSYMLQLKLNFSILLGESLQVFYDVPNEKKPRKIYEIQFEMDSQEGINIIKLLSKNEYSPEKIENYCEEKIALEAENNKAAKYIEKLCSIEGSEIITELLREKLSSEFSGKIISFIFDKINIGISKKGTPRTEETEYAIPKSEAIKIINKKHKTNLTNSNTMYSKIINGREWSSSRLNSSFASDTFIILVNQNNREFHYFFIAGGTITEPENTFSQRNDRTDCSKIYIPIAEQDNFMEKNRRFPFGNYIKDTIKY